MARVQLVAFRFQSPGLRGSDVIHTSVVDGRYRHGGFAEGSANSAHWLSATHLTVEHRQHTSSGVRAVTMTRLRRVD